MIKVRFLCFVFFFGLLWNKAFSEQFRFKHFNTSDGLSSNSIRCITQDNQGFIWFGTENGLTKFDGHEFKAFKGIPGDSTSLGSNYINVISEDSRKTCWIGTDNGVYHYNPEIEQFSRFTKLTEENVGIFSGTTQILEDKKGNIWFATEGQGVFLYEWEEDKLIQFNAKQNQAGNSLNSDLILSLFIDSEGAIWVSTKTLGQSLHLYDEKTKNFSIYPIKNNSPLFIIYAIAEDANGTLWLGSWENGLCKLDKKDKTIREFCSPHKDTGISHIHSILAYERDLLLVGSDDGLLLFNTKTFASELMTSSELTPDGLSDKFIYPIYKDREGGLWVGGYYKGVNYSPPNRGYIEGFTHSKYKNSVGGSIISCFCEDESGNMWIGSDDGGLSYFDCKTKVFTNHMPVPGKNSLSYHNIHALHIHNGKLWIGTYTGGLNTYDLKTGRFKCYLPEANNPRSLDGSSVYSIFKANNGDLWIGTMQGINRFHDKTDDFSREQTTAATTVDIVQEKDNTLWFATWGVGLYHFLPETSEWIHYTANRQDENALPNNMVLCLCIDKSERLWIGTDNGLCFFDKENNRFIREPLSIPSNSITNIIDYDGLLWLSTANGFVSFSPTTKETKVFTTSDGLQNDQLTINGSLLSSDNKMYLGTTNGFNIMCPQTFNSNKYIPPVVITNLQIFNKDQKTGISSLLKKAIGFTDELVLTYKQSVVSIEYAALSYSAPGKNQYKYILEGFDKEWNHVGNQQKATYTNLPSGKYMFRIMGSNNDGIWNERETALAIRVLPPFWRSTWAYLVYIMLISVSIFYIVYTIRRRAERRNKVRIRKLHAEKEKELYNAKINFFTQVAHEIRTPVSLIIGPLEKIIEQSQELKPTIQEDLLIINKNSQRLLSLVNQLLDFRKAEQGAFTPSFSPQNIYTLSQNIYDRFNPLITKKGIGFEFIMDNKELIAHVDAEAYTKVVSNLLTNAAKHAKVQISIKISNNNTHFCLQVTDDGAGINDSEIKNIFKPFYQIAGTHKPGTGIGLSLVKLLIEAHHGMIDVSSTSGKTEFLVTLPVAQGALSSKTSQESDLLSDINEYALSLDDENEIAFIPEENRSTLLIVEDNTDLCSFLSNRFRHTYNIFIAHNGKEALEVLKKQSVDIIISDIMMPVMDGIEFCREIKSNLLYSHIPIVLLTAKTEHTAKVESIQTGADAYIEKPFSVKLLEAQLENLLNSRKLLKKKFSEMPFMKLDSIAGNKADEVFLSKLNSIIEENISNIEFSIDVLAEQLCISRSGLFSKIKTLTDMTPNELIHLVRLKKAAELLSREEYRINEICYMVGFNNPSYFSKCFQKQFGVLPKDFTSKQHTTTTS